jgi:hypothetical protein
MNRVKITLMFFQLIPDPTWEMPEDKVKEFFEINTWKELMITEDNSNLSRR